MAAPSADFPAPGASTSSSGYTDGLGRRALAFDREDGSMLERLVVRAELSAFERSLRERVERIAALDDERLARPRSIERGADGTLVVLSEFVPGTRLSDILDATAQQGTVPGVDVALGFLLDVLPALCGLHAGAGFAHGAINPGRTVLTPAGQVVLLDAIYGDALSRLHYSRRLLWDEFGLAMPPAAGPVRFDAAADIAQAALSAVMLVLGRPLAYYEYPDGIASLLVEVVDVAQIGGSAGFAAGLQRFLQRSLPVQGRRPYTAADDALIDVRDLAREIGLDVCRRALVDFIEQQEGGQSSAAYAETGDAGEYTSEYFSEDAVSGANGDFDADGDGDGLEIDLDLDGASGRREETEDTVYDLDAASDTQEETESVATETSRYEPAIEDSPAEETRFEDTPIEAAPIPAAPIEASQIEEVSIEEAPSEFAAALESVEQDVYTSALDPLPDPLPDPEPALSADDLAGMPASETTDEDAESEHLADPLAESEPADESKSSRRRKRSRSARSRKDKLRSAARPPAPLTPPEPPPRPAPPPPPPAPIAAPVPATKPTQSGWLVEPSRAAAFEPPVPLEPPPPPSFSAPKPPPIVAAPPPVVVAPAPAPPPPIPQPVAPPPMPRPIALAPPAPPPPAPIRTVAPPPPPAPALKLKSEAPAGYAPSRKPRNDLEDLYAPVAPPPPQESKFPWKLASAAGVLMVIGIAAGRAYWPAGSDQPRTVVIDNAAPAAATAAPAPVARTGRLEISTTPTGARILLNGKHVGESPLALEVPAGRHTLTFAAKTGSVRKPVRVEAGKTEKIDVSIFSGFIEVFAPILLDVSENGKSLGTTEQNRLMLTPGRHELTFSNRDLDYTSTHVVEIEPGDGKTLRLDPQGSASINASPWAEVWLGGKKIGDTPLANQALPLGTHELVFKYQQVEKRVTTTIRANSPVTISLDMLAKQ